MNTTSEQNQDKSQIAQVVTTCIGNQVTTYQIKMLLDRLAKVYA